MDKGKLTPAEQEVSKLLADAWNRYIKLEKQFPGECVEFAEGIDKCHLLMAIRIARRTNPENFPTMSDMINPNMVHTDKQGNVG